MPDNSTRRRPERLPWQPTLLPALLLVIAASLSSSGAQLISCGHCVCDRPSITCDFDKTQARIKESSLTLAEFAPSSGVLRDLGLQPEAYRDLYINCKNSRALKDQRLTRALLADFANLTRVSIVKCDLVAIEADALAQLPQLMELDLGDNRLERLPPGLLRGKTMGALTLSENPHLALDAGSFQGVRLERLVLSKCQLAEFPWASLQAVGGLQELTLSQNNIKFVPRAALEFATQLRVFYLDDNPLSCTCANAWLGEQIRWDRVSPAIIQSTKLPRCGSPPAVRYVEITRLAAPADFPCQPPEIRSVDLRLLGDSAAQLVCSAAATDQPGPLVWTYRHVPVYPDIPNGYPSRTYQSSGPVFRQSVQRTPGYEREKYTVTAAGQDGRTVNFSLTVHWPDAASPPRTGDTDGASPPAAAATVTPSDSQQQPPGDGGGAGADYFSRKQFTLIEMIIAVIGTFMATSLVFLLSCQFTRWYNKRDKKRWAAGYAGAAQPYAYNYNSHRNYSSNRPPSHEYDVPRMDHQPCLPKLQSQQQQQHQALPPPPLPLPLSTSAAAQSVSTTAAAGPSSTALTMPKPPLQLPPPPPPTSSSSSCGVTVGELEFLDYNGHRLVFNHA